MCGPNSQLQHSENNAQQQPQSITALQQPQQQPQEIMNPPQAQDMAGLQQQQGIAAQQLQEADLKGFKWQDQSSFYNSVSTKEKKKNYKFRVLDEKKIQEILDSDVYKKDKASVDAINQKKSKLRFHDQRKVKDRLFDANASILKKDKKSWWRKDSTKMQDIKIAMDRVQMLMQMDLRSNPKFVTKEGRLDFKAIGTTLKNEFEKAMELCDAYLGDKKKQGSGSTAKRRRGNVQTCRDMMEKELNTFRILVQPNIEFTLIGNQENIHTPRDILSGIKVINVGNVRHQNQGNSQEVYVVDVKQTDVEGILVEAMDENGKIIQYYMKENLPMLDKTTNLYIDRRIKELTNGQKFKNSPDEKEKEREEYRMKKSGTDDTDYLNGIEFLTEAKKELNKGDAKKNEKAKDDFCKFLAHDFDSLFRSYEEYKRLMAKGISQEELNALRLQAREDPIKSLLYESLAKQSAGQKVDLLGPFEWLIEAKIINYDKKNPLYKILEKISKQPDVKRDGKSTSRLEVLLRVTTGKEAELYGQMTARAKGGTDMSQYLTMMTSEMGTLYNFDVLCKTYMAVTDFTRWDDEEASGAVVTLQEEAKGTEWIELQKQAMKYGKKVKLSPNASRQLISLQVIDTICAQTDRHGRNFKCQYEEQDGDYIVTSIKAYDHDMSFSEVTLEGAFEKEKDKDKCAKILKKNGFLPPMIQKISPKSPIFRHLRRNYLGRKPEHVWLDEIKPAMYEKTWNEHITEKETRVNENNEKEDVEVEKVVQRKEMAPIPPVAKDSFLTVFYKSKLSFIEYNGEKKKRGDYYCVVNQPSDIFENCQIYRDDMWHFISKRGKDGDKDGSKDIKISKQLFNAKPKWARDVNELNKMPYEEFAKKIDQETAESLGIKNDDKNAAAEEADAMKALWKFSRIISELGRLMIPQEKNGKEYEYNGENVYGDERNLYKSSLVLKRTYEEKGIISYTEEEKRRIIELGKQLKNLNEKWDFTGLCIKGKIASGSSFQGGDDYNRVKNGFRMPEKSKTTGSYSTDPQPGFFDGYVQSTLEYIATMFKNDPVLEKMDEHVPDELKEFYDEESGTISLPSVLHMDKADYERAEKIVHDFEKGALKARMRSRQLSEDSIQAAVSRAQETVAQINKMKDMAEKILRLKYPDVWEENKNKTEEEKDPRIKFFLTAKEFEELDDLSDLAIDPGDTYLVQDDDDYMSTQEKYKDCMTQTELNDAKDRRNKAYMDQKRWMGTGDKAENFKPDVSAVDMKLGKLKKSEPAA